MVMVVMMVVGMATAAFAGTYKNKTIDSDFGQAIAFNEMGKGSCSFVAEVTDDLWGGYANTLVKKALAANADFKDGVITNFTKVNGTDDVMTVVEVKGGKVVKAKVYIF